MYKYSFNMQYTYTVDDIVCGVLSGGLFTLLHPSQVGLYICNIHSLLFQLGNVYYRYLMNKYKVYRFQVHLWHIEVLVHDGNTANILVRS